MIVEEPKVVVDMNDDKTIATVSVSFPWMKQALAFAQICETVLKNMKPIVEGEDYELSLKHH